MVPGNVPSAQSVRDAAAAVAIALALPPRPLLAQPGTDDEWAVDDDGSTVDGLGPTQARHGADDGRRTA